jgi:hypothetical protein
MITLPFEEFSKQSNDIIKKFKNWDEFLAHENANYWLYCYAKDVIKTRWPEAEKFIMEDPRQACFYAEQVIKGRWPEAEEYIIKNFKLAFWYAKDVIKGRWPEAEKCIMEDPEYWGRYQGFLKTLDK